MCAGCADGSVSSLLGVEVNADLESCPSNMEALKYLRYFIYYVNLGTQLFILCILFKVNKCQ